jgi:hypothetical protein
MFIKLEFRKLFYIWPKLCQDAQNASSQEAA